MITIDQLKAEDKNKIYYQAYDDGKGNGFIVYLGENDDGNKKFQHLNSSHDLPFTIPVTNKSFKLFDMNKLKPDTLRKIGEYGGKRKIKTKTKNTKTRKTKTKNTKTRKTKTKKTKARKTK